VSFFSSSSGKKFYDPSLDPAVTWDTINGVGLRNHYLCTVYAARLMAPHRAGLIVNVSSIGGLKYLFNVAYGVGKAACDRMAADCAAELRSANVAMVALWPGPVRYSELLHRYRVRFFIA
jgi:dehydrogenase/reductase SDR family protein 1